MLAVGAQALVWTDGGPWTGRLASAVAALAVARVAWRRTHPVTGLAVLSGTLAVDAGGPGHLAAAFVPAFAALLLLVFSVGERGGAARHGRRRPRRWSRPGSPPRSCCGPTRSTGC